MSTEQQMHTVIIGIPKYDPHTANVSAFINYVKKKKLHT